MSAFWFTGTFGISSTGLSNQVKDLLYTDERDAWEDRKVLSSQVTFERGSANISQLFLFVCLFVLVVVVVVCCCCFSCQAQSAVLGYDQHTLTRTFKFGVLPQRKGQVICDVLNCRNWIWLSCSPGTFVLARCGRRRFKYGFIQIFLPLSQGVSFFQHWRN